MKQLSLFFLAFFMVFGVTDILAQSSSYKRTAVAKRNITSLKKADVKQTRKLEQAAKVRYSDGVQLSANRQKAKCGSSDPRIKGRYGCNDVAKVMRERQFKKVAETNTTRTRLSKLQTNRVQRVRQESIPTTTRKINRPSSVQTNKRVPVQTRKAVKVSDARF